MKRKTTLSVVALVLCCAAVAQAASPAAPATAPPAASPDDGPTLYTLGQLISRTLERFTLTPEELAMVQQGIEDGVLGRPPKVDLAAEAPKLHALQAARSEALAARGRQAGAAVLAGAASAPGTVRLPTGVLLQPLQPGDGPAPTATDHVRVHY
ncbi:MAG: FKBP-type peptidyl-prolyl cis-trans isomerase, partial [Gammaproteobacteria bacterium]